MQTILLMTAALLALDGPARSAGSADEDKQRQEEVARLAPAKARQLEVLSGGDDPVPAVLHEQPLLRWSNPTAGSVYGEVFVWHVEGRPVALASIFRWYHPFKDGTVEITSLATNRVSAREGPQVQWECEPPGVTFQDMPDVRPPASAAGVRLTQMRAVARRFAAQLEDTRSGEQIARKLRLLNQPLHRYASPKQGIVDGALFALAEVTDPEVIVMIEVASDGVSQQWRYALARMNNHELEVRLDDKVVKSWPRINAPWKDRRSSYTLFSFDPQAVTANQPTSKP